MGYALTSLIHVRLGTRVTQGRYTQGGGITLERNTTMLWRGKYFAVLAIGCWISGGWAVAAEETKTTAGAEKAASESSTNPEKTQRAVERALEFMVKDAEKWRASKGCATCHHGTMTVWALNE